jgi:hypothetical protein
MFEVYYAKYMKNMVSVTTLDKLAAAGKLTREEVERMISDRLERYGY